MESPTGSQPDSPAHWFESLADHLGPAYLRYSFTKGTVQEVDALVVMTELVAGSRVLDVGCGPGRHSLEFARRGFDVVGVDISATFVDLARRAASAAEFEHCHFVHGDARHLLELGRIEAGSFDLVVSLCQGAFGLTGGPDAAAQMTRWPSRELDEPILAGMAAAVRPGGWVVASAFSSYFQLRYADGESEDSSPSDDVPSEPIESFDAVSGINHEWTSVMNPAGVSEPAELWTTCYTPRELRLLSRLVGLDPVAIHGVTPGRYKPEEPSTDCPEFLLLAKPNPGAP